MKAIPLPEQTTLSYRFFFTCSGSPFREKGSDDSLVFAYYWVVDNGLSEDELMAHFSSHVDTVSRNFTGWRASVHIFPLGEYYKMDANVLGELDKFAREFGADSKYLVLVGKPGRLLLFN